MLSLSRARALLSAASSLDRLAAIARELGLAGPARDLDPTTRSALGIPAEARRVQIVRGPGCTRALLLDTGSAPLKDALTRTAAHLASRAPQLLWLLLAMDGDRKHVAIAAFSPDCRQPRIRALVCELDNVVDSDAETVCVLASAQVEIDVLMHCRWTEILGREAMTRRFYTVLERVVESLARSIQNGVSRADARELALLYVSRLLFLSFLETQGWLNGDHGFLANGFADCMASGGRYHSRVLEPLFFGTLNTPPRARSPRAQAFGKIPFLNGGLFARSSLERRARRVAFPDEVMGILYGDLLCRHRFTPREDSSEWSEAAVDPEMLGKAFESLMASGDRKSSGAFYTPQSLVQRVMREALAHALQTPRISSDQVESCLLARDVPPGIRPALLDGVRSLRLLDPACGSGAFLVFALSELTWLAGACGDGRPVGEVTRSILTSSIFGVDANPVAVWLCELRLWLAMAMQQRERDMDTIEPLPNLDRQIRVGDTLAGGSFAARRLSPPRSVARLRARYTRAHGQRKRVLARLLDRTERALAIDALTSEIAAVESARRELLLAARARDLFGARHPPSAETRRGLSDLRTSLRELERTRAGLSRGAALPFSFAVHFSEIAAADGFNLVVGNPPWVRLHHIPARMRARLREEFAVFQRASWATGASSANAGAGFGGQVDMAALFVERSLQLVRTDGVVALLLPAKLWSSLAGGGVRAMLREDATLVTLEDLSGAEVAFDAAVYPSLLLARKGRASAGDERARLCVHRRCTPYSWRMPRAQIAFDDSIGSPWVLAPPDVRAAFEKLRRAGIPLAHTRLGRPLLGVKSGCNEAFVVQAEGVDDSGSTRIHNATRSDSIEAALLRPAIRGEQITPWRCGRNANRVIWTHASDGTALRSLPPHAKRWLAHYRDALEKRADGGATDRWWSLFRTDGAMAGAPRVVWADFGKRPRAAVLPAGDDSVPLNTCYVIKCRSDREALALAAILNSDLAAAWLNLLAEPARGGYHRYLGWTVSLLPLPRDWTAACAILPEVARRAVDDRADPGELLDAVLAAYAVRHSDVAPLLAWAG